MSVLTDIQNELKVPKKRTNSFGGYKYRNAEDILEAVKPLLKKYDATLSIFDSVEEIGGRVYVKATAELQGKDYDIASTAYAREAESKKGMDESQITGTASSYARKYALNGLFLIDDTKDADSDEYVEEVKNRGMVEKKANEKISKAKAKALEKKLTDAGAKIEKLLDHYGIASLEELTEEQHYEIIGGLA